MSEKRRAADEEIVRAFEKLDDAGATYEGDAETDAAFRTLIHLMPQTPLRHDFSDRVMVAVQRMEPSAPRRRLRARRRSFVAAGAGLAAAGVTGTALWTSGLLQLFVTQVLLDLVRGGLLAIRSSSFIFETVRWIGVTVRALTVIMASTQILSVLAVVAVLSILSLAALTRLVSS
jgi:hypothetical protein